MKQLFTLLLAALMVFSLTACGRNNKQPQENTANDSVVNNDAQQNQNDHANNQENGVLDNNGTNHSTGSNGTTDNAAGNSGVSYGQMLENGTVHDSDGLLNDGENAVSDVVRGTEDAVNDVARGTRNAVNDVLR